MGDLKPCPFCGGSPSIEIGLHNFNDVQITCDDCSMHGPNFDDGPVESEARDYNRNEAIQHWNTRHD